MAVNKLSIEDIGADPNKIGTRYTVGNPHPGYLNQDPNIMNEYGHTHYPKWINHPTEKETHTTTTYLGKDQSRTNVIETEFPKRVLVNSKEEEEALLGKSKKVSAWNKE